MSVWDRFWSKVDCPPSISREQVQPPYNPRSRCWPWLAARIPEGYGLFWLNGKYRGAHRIAYELMFACKIMDGMEIDHLCRNPSCVNPNHLQPVTRRTNQLRSNSVSGRAARKTQCPQGHPYNDENTYWFRTKRGGLGRQCRTCNKARQQARRKR